MRTAAVRVSHSYPHALPWVRVVVRGFAGVHGPLLVMCSAVIVSAFSLIYVANASRMLHAEIQHTLAARDSMHIEWQKLLLERSATIRHVRDIAGHRLGMMAPDARSMTVLSPG